MATDIFINHLKESANSIIQPQTETLLDKLGATPATLILFGIVIYGISFIMEKLADFEMIESESPTDQASSD